MKIGIIGVGNIGGLLSKKLAAAGHDVKVANSRGPETIEADVLITGARAVTASEAVKDVEAVILSTPFSSIPALAPLIAGVPAETVIIDTSNYYPLRDSHIEAIDDGLVESIWVSEQLGHPVTKAWNALFAGSLANKGAPAGAPGRVAIPVAGDTEQERAVTSALVEATGFDAVDAGPLSESWRFQPGTPGYCTDLSSDELPGALASAELARSRRRRDLAVAVVTEVVGDFGTQPSEDFGVQLSRLLFTA